MNPQVWNLLAGIPQISRGEKDIHNEGNCIGD